MKNQNVSVHIPVTMLASYWKGDFQKLPANRIYELIIDYPFGGAREHHFPIKTGKHGLGLVGLLSKIGKAYEKIYEDPSTNGVFGHDIDDLNLSGVRVNHKTKKIRLDVDS
jgi:hypothetical protein